MVFLDTVYLGRKANMSIMICENKKSSFYTNEKINTKPNDSSDLNFKSQIFKLKYFTSLSRSKMTKLLCRMLNHME